MNSHAIELRPTNDILLSPSELNWLKKGHAVRVRIGNWPPYHFSEDGVYKGISVEYLKKIFTLHNIKYEFVSGEKILWEDALKHIRNHQLLDVLITAKITKKRKKHMIFTNEYLHLPWVIFNRVDSSFVSSINDLNGKVVSVPRGFVMERLLAKKYPLIQLQSFSQNNSVERCLEALAEGRVDAYIGNLTVGSYIILKEGYNNIKVAAPTPFGAHNQAMAVRNDWPDLAEIINKTLKSLSAKEHAQIRNKWLSVRYEHGLRSADLAKWVLTVSGFFTMILLISLFWNRRLKKEILVRMLAEENLKISEGRFRSLSDAAFEAIFILDNDIIQDANNTAALMFGYTEDELVGMTATDFVDPKDYKNVKTNIISSSDQTYEAVGVKKDGTQFPIEIRGKMFSSYEKKIRVTAVRDLTEKKKS